MLPFERFLIDFNERLFFIRYSWTENLYGSSSFPSSPPTQNKLDEPSMKLPAFEDTNETFTFYPTSPSASNSSLLEVTDHLGNCSTVDLLLRLKILE